MIDELIKINGTTVTTTGNSTLERNIQEEKDSGKIKIVSTKDTRYEMYDKVDITTVYDNEEQYLIQGDNPIQLNATEYEHNLTLFENIAFFDTLYPADRSFKVIGQTLEDILTAYKREFEAYHNVYITWTTIPQAVLDETIPYKEFAGQNFSSILMSIFRKIWAVPKVNRVGDVWDIYPLYHNARNNSIASESISKMSQQNNVDYATKVKSQLKNAVNERLEGEVTWFPSESGYVLPRSSDLIASPSKLRYELDSDIITILKAEAVGMTLETTDVTSSTNYTYTNIDIDITDRIIQEDAWDSLNVTTDIHDYEIVLTENVKNHIRYTVGDKYINKLWEKGSDGIIFDEDTEYLINAIWKAWYNDTGKDPEFGEIPNDITPSATKDVKMRFKYVRRRNIDLVHSRKTKGNMNNITTIHQQRDASVELNEYKKNLKLYSNRMGNNMYSKTKVFNYPDEPYELFDYTDEKTIVTRVQNTYHNKFVYCEYEESENFSNIEAEYALMRRSDPYTITAKSVTTNLIYQEFIEFSTIQRDLNTRFEDEARELLAGQFDTSPIALEKVAVGVFKPDLTSWNTLHAIHMPVEASGDGNLITVHVQFTHQNIAGKTYYDLDNSTYQTYLNPLPYTDVDGRLEDFELFFTPDILVEDSGEYPLILNDANYLLNAYTTSGLTDPLDLDSAASFAETLQVSLVADENIYIGNVLASDNFFIKDQVLPAPGIEIYTSTKPYGQYDQAPRDDDTDNTLNITYNYSFANRTITLTPSIEVDYFSIVRNGKILLAVNQNIPAGVSYTIYLNYVREIFVVLMEAYATDLSDLSISLTLAYSNRLYDLEAKSSALSILDVSATLAYTDRTFTMSAKSSALSSISGTCALAYTDSDYSLEAYSSALSSLSGTAILTYSGLEYSMEAYASGLSSLSGTATLGSVIQVGWVEVSTGTVTGGDCLVPSDIDNIKSVTENNCIYVQDGDAYDVGMDLSTTQPLCTENASYTLCVKFGLDWRCRDYLGTIVQEDVLYKCEII